MALSEETPAADTHYVEHSLLPFEASTLLGEKLLVLAPHPDDEVIGCGGLIALHVAEKRPVKVVILTDGAAADPAGEQELVRRRREETLAGLAILGEVETVFCEFSDRSLEEHEEALREILRHQIVSFRPDLIACPSPIEIHPDHVALARALSDLMQESRDLLGEAAMTRVAFYEVSQPMRPNALVDITTVGEKKYRAIRAHASQLALRDYESFARGLNQYRAMTLPPAVKAAEAYQVRPLVELHTTSWTELQDAAGPAKRIEVTREEVPITVIVRTRDRLPLLRQAIESIQGNDLRAEIVVVNDGGASPREILPRESDVLLIDNSSSRGRSEAMNAGVRAAATPFVAFLDDDDLYHSDHLATLARAASTTAARAWYTDAVSVSVEMDERGDLVERNRQRIYAQPFDRELLFIDNYIPLLTLLVKRDDYLGVGGFDPEFDLFEDWDFLLRLARGGDFVRVPRITCDIRHVQASGSVIADSPAWSRRFHDAKIAIWKRHLPNPAFEVMLNVFERQKQRLLSEYSRGVEATGLVSHLQLDLTRFDREKQYLLELLASTARERDLGRADLEERSAALERLNEELAQTRESAALAREMLTTTGADLAKHREVVSEQEQSIKSLYGEIDRLNKLLETIYASRTWKVHRALDSLRRRGGDE